MGHETCETRDVKIFSQFVFKNIDTVIQPILALPFFIR